MKIERKINFKRICPECHKFAHIITHHIITKNLVKYLIEIHNYDAKSIRNLRNQLTVEICKECENEKHGEKK
jgi:hypothetical protein